jgi:chaperonin cofactor prefoldin
MSKMTDEQIINALKKYIECAESTQIARDVGGTLVISLLQNALDLINRQQAEIEKLTINMNAFGLGMKREKERADTIRAETIKEFESKIHEKLHEAERHGNFEPVVTREMFDSVVKELVGEGNG